MNNSINFIGVQLTYKVVLVSDLQQSKSVVHVYIYIYPFLFRFFFYIGYNTVLNGLPCAIK